MTQFQFTPLLIVKVMGSMIMSVLGMYYLNVGQKERDVKVMVEGAVLVLMSLFLFF